MLGIVVSDKMVCFMFSQYKSKAEGKTQKSIQSSTSTDNETQYRKVNTTHKRGSAISQQVITCLCKICHFQECDIYTTGLLFVKSWWRSTRLCYIPTIKTLGIVVSNKKIFSLKIYFSPCDLDMQWTKLFEQLFKRVI